MSQSQRVARSRWVGAVLLGLAVALLAGAEAAAETRVYVVDATRSQLRFHATSRFMDADGRFTRFAGEVRLDDGRLETASGRLTVEVASIDTGITLRDNHLRSEDFLDAERHPRATFVLSSVRAEGGRYQVTGELTIRGVTRPVAAPVTATLAGETLRIVGNLTLNRRDFGVAYQSRLNPVGDEVKMSFDLVTVRR